MKLKGCLKGLCTLGFTTLLISFASAGLQEFDLGLAEEITANINLGYTLELENNANFLLNDQYKIIQFAGNSTYPSTRTYFWNGSGMYVINSCVGGYSCDGSILGQGYFNYVNIVELSSINYNYYVSEGFTPISEFLENSIYNSPDKILLGGYSDMQSASLCFGYSDINKAVCFSFNRANWDNCGGHPQFCTNGQLSYITDSQGYTSQDLDYLSSFATNSPFSSSTPSISETYLDSDYNNQDVMLSWSRLGYTKNLCYSDFSIDRLFDMSGNVSQIFDNDLEDGMGYGTGATVFDLYSGSSASNFASFWSSSINRVNTMLITDTISTYWSGRPVGQAYLSYKLNERLYGNSNFNLTDYYQFCQFALGLSDSQWDSNYTGSKLPSDVESQLETEKHIRICSMTGAENSAFCGGFSAGGGAGGGGSRPASISDFYNSAFSILEARDGLNLTGDGILPYYISLGFIAFLLLYLLKR